MKPQNDQDNNASEVLFKIFFKQNIWVFTLKQYACAVEYLIFNICDTLGCLIKLTLKWGAESMTSWLELTIEFLEYSRYNMIERPNKE